MISLTKEQERCLLKINRSKIWPYVEKRNVRGKLSNLSWTALKVLEKWNLIAVRTVTVSGWGSYYNKKNLWVNNDKFGESWVEIILTNEGEDWCYKREQELAAPFNLSQEDS